MNVASLLGHPVVQFPATTDALVLSNCNIGIECELENFVPATTPRGMSTWWRSVEDNSLRNDGRELIFKEPTAGAEAALAINALYDHWRDSWQIHERGSMHVHIDVRDMRVDQYLLFRIYSLALDELLFQYAPERFSNPFCRAASRSRASILALQHMVGTPASHWDRARAFLSPDRKYLSINVNSGITFGSMEFRHFQVPRTREEMFLIVNTLLTIKKCAMDTAQGDSDTNLKRAIGRMDHSAIKEAFPDAVPSIVKHLRLIEVL